MTGARFSESQAFGLIDLDYTLPPDRIAQQPLLERDAARLLLLDRASGVIRDRVVRDLPELLRAGDLLVLNNSRVVPAKLRALRRTGGRVSGLFLREESTGVWKVMLEGSKRLEPRESLLLLGRENSEFELHLLEREADGIWRVRVDGTVGDRQATMLSAIDVLDAVGETPLPPYIRRGPVSENAANFDAEPSESNAGAERPGAAAGRRALTHMASIAGQQAASPNRAPTDRERYQTVYAERPGAVAAPTAGLHFTNALLARLREAGIETAFVTLHVGVGTFKPIAVDDLAQHRMHSESYELPAATAAAVAACRRRSGRVVAVGTTSVRVLETCAEALSDSDARDLRGETHIFIHPPYRFRATDALLTNFHLPRSTLLALVMALAGTERTRTAYAHAIEHGYRFYSYGDAMLIL